MCMCMGSRIIEKRTSWAPCVGALAVLEAAVKCALLGGVVWGRGAHTEALAA
jgi:hypothetical protein